MTDENPHHQSRELTAGELVYLRRDPGGNWQISSYECQQRVRYNVRTGGLELQFRQRLSDDWRDLEFESVDDATRFVESQIQDGKSPANNRHKQ